MSLTDTTVRNAKPRDKAYKLADEKGLYLFVDTNGSKYWRMKYRFLGKEKILSFGVYPDVSLAEARDKRDEARKQIRNDIDPGIFKKFNKQKTKSETEDTFEAIAREWYVKNLPTWDEEYAKGILRRLEKDLFPWLGHKPITEITPTELLIVLRRVESRALEVAHRELQYVRKILYAIAIQRAKHNIAADLEGALSPMPEDDHFASITDPVSIGGLMRAINGYAGQLVTKCALRLAPLVFVRPGELRKAEWTQFNFEIAEWRIPPTRMKKTKNPTPHIVPLSTQAISILNELMPVTGDGKYLFPSVRTPIRPMSENTVLAALRRMGYTGDEMTGHGFRSMASTRLNEQGWNRDAIERQLAHMERDSVRAAYNYAEYLPERRKMMQYWADYLDSLANKSNK